MKHALMKTTQWFLKKKLDYFDSLSGSVAVIYDIWCSNCKPTYFELKTGQIKKISNGYNSIILKASIMKILPRVENCGPSPKMAKNLTY